MHNFYSMPNNFFIQFLNVSIIRNNSLILKDLNFSIRKGDFVCLLGNTGSGKSSLLQSIYGQLPIQQGNIVVDEILVHQIDSNTLPYLRRKIGIISDTFPLDPKLSVVQNLDFVLSVTDWSDTANKSARIQQILALLGIEHLKNQKTDQLTKKEYLKTLIGRALLNAPSILLVDAPVQHLDVQAAQEILDFIYQYAQDHNIVVILATVNNKIPQLLDVDKILLCQNNTVEEIE